MGTSEKSRRLPLQERCSDPGESLPALDLGPTPGPKVDGREAVVSEAVVMIRPGVNSRGNLSPPGRRHEPCDRYQALPHARHAVENHHCRISPFVLEQRSYCPHDDAAAMMKTRFAPLDQWPFHRGRGEMVTRGFPVKTGDALREARPLSERRKELPDGRKPWVDASR